MLQEFAERLKANVRPKDIVCRPGGEEFLVIMPETSGDLACSAAERLRRSIAGDPFALPNGMGEIDITVSVGVATIGGEDDTVSDLMRRADEALYKAKFAGRNRVESIAA